MKTAIIGGALRVGGCLRAGESALAGEAVEYTLFEAGSRLGGHWRRRWWTERYWKGPDSFYRRSRRQRSFAASWGWGGPDSLERRGAEDVHSGEKRMVPLPDGLMFLVPTKLIPTALTRLFSLKTRYGWGLNCCIRRAPGKRTKR